MLLRCRVHVGPCSATAADCAPRHRVHDDTVHRTEVDHHPVVAHRISGVAVAAAANRNFESGAAGEGDGVGDLRSRAATRYQRGLAVDGAVPDRAQSVIVRVPRYHHLTFESTTERRDALRRHFFQDQTPKALLWG